MTNHFRTLLLNLSYDGAASEFIPREFTARPLAGPLLNFYNMLFPEKSSRADKLKLAQAYLELVKSAGLEGAFTLVDSRITYDLATDFDNFKSTSLSLEVLQNKISANPSKIEAMLSCRQYAGDSSYDNVWRQHPNLVYKIAGLIAAYVTRLK